MTATLDLDTITLKHGAHRSLDDGACLLEAVSYIAREPWSDHPQCVCPALAAFGRAWNDGLPDDATRTRLLAPFIPRLIGTRSTPDVQDARAFMASDWAVRTYTPAWLRLAGLDDEAAALEALPEMTSAELCRAAMPTIDVARKKAAAAGDAAGAAAGAAAWAAAWAAAGDAAGDAAWAAAGDAAGDAAGAAAGAAAWAAARDAARAAAGAAAGAAAWAAARAKLAPVVDLLQVSAAELFSRMIDLTEVAA
jgi:hypothetical protein